MLERRCSVRVTQKREREREREGEIKNAKSLKRGQGTILEEEWKEREREITKARERNKSTRVHARLSPFKYTRATKPSLELVSHKFFSKAC